MRVSEVDTMLYSQSYSIFPGAPIQFGPGVAKTFGGCIAAMGSCSALVVTERSLFEIGVTDGPLASLKAANIDFEIFSGTEPNAPIAVVQQIVSLLESGRFDTIIGIGGGSAMDLAKAGRLFASNPNALTTCNLAAHGSYIPKKSKLKLFTIPTLSGSGCEYMSGAVISNSETHEKVTLIAGDLEADMAFIDPELQLGIPASVTVPAAVDAMCHAFNKLCAPGCDFQYRHTMSLDAVKAIWNALPVIVSGKLNDLESRSALCYGGLMAGYINGGPSGNINHPIAHTIGHFFSDVPHGIACAWALPVTLRHLLPVSEPDTVSALAALTGITPSSDTLADDIAGAFAKWLKRVGVVAPANWNNSISLDDWLAIAPYVKADGTWGMNPRYQYPDDATIEQYLKEAYYDFD